MPGKSLTIAQRFVVEFAGHPLRVACNVVLTATAGVLFDHLLLGAPLDERLVFGALMAPLLAIVLAGSIKAFG